MVEFKGGVLHTGSKPALVCSGTEENRQELKRNFLLLSGWVRNSWAAMNWTMGQLQGGAGEKGAPSFIHTPLTWCTTRPAA